VSTLSVPLSSYAPSARHGWRLAVMCHVSSTGHQLAPPSIGTPYKHTTGSALQSYNYFGTAIQFTVYVIRQSLHYFMTCAKRFTIYTYVCSEVFKGNNDAVTICVLTSPLLFLSGQGVRNLRRALDVFNFKVILRQCQSPTSQPIVPACYRF